MTVQIHGRPCFNMRRRAIRPGELPDPTKYGTLAATPGSIHPVHQSRLRPHRLRRHPSHARLQHPPALYRPSQRSAPQTPTRNILKRGTSQATGRSPANRGVCLANGVSTGFHQQVADLGQRSVDMIANAFSAGFDRTIHRAWPSPVGSSERFIRYRHLSAETSEGKWSRTFTTRRCRVSPFRRQRAVAALPLTARPSGRRDLLSCVFMGIAWTTGAT